jgi:hypothetical protein
MNSMYGNGVRFDVEVSGKFVMFHSIMRSIRPRFGANSEINNINDSYVISALNPNQHDETKPVFPLVKIRRSIDINGVLGLSLNLRISVAGTQRHRRGSSWAAPSHIHHQQLSINRHQKFFGWLNLIKYIQHLLLIVPLW